MNKWKKIESILNDTNRPLDDVSRIELCEQLSIYHEELLFQNQELKRINEDLTGLKNDYKELFDIAPVGYFIIDKKGKILKANSYISKNFDIKFKTNIIDYIEPSSEKKLNTFLKTLWQTNESRENVIFKSSDKSLPMELIGKSVISKENNYLIACLNLEKQFQSMEEMKALSFKDPLTNLYNRRYFEEKLYSMNQAEYMPFSVIIGDVNGLKLVNDTFGHSEGDALLKTAGEQMLKLGRSSDVIARIGGDEFAILLPNISEASAKNILERFNNSCSNLKIDKASFSIAFGSATINDVAENIEEIMIKAEEKMYQSKRSTEEQKGAKIINSILLTLYEKHPREELHSKKVAEYMRKIGTYLGYDKNHIEKMEKAGLFHNVGKVAIDPNILNHIATLSYDDYSELKKHVEIGYRILKSSSVFSQIAHIVLYHQEWVNGKGYPKKLKGSEIPIESRILSICVAYEYMISETSYREAMAQDDVLAQLETGADTQFDKELLNTFVTMIRNDKEPAKN